MCDKRRSGIGFDWCTGSVVYSPMWNKLHVKLDFWQTLYLVTMSDNKAN